MPRLETGPCRPEDDWCGVFIRGDNALAYARALRTLLEAPEDRMAKSGVTGLANILNSCREPVERAQAVRRVDGES